MVAGSFMVSRYAIIHEQSGFYFEYVCDGINKNKKQQTEPWGSPENAWTVSDT